MANRFSIGSGLASNPAVWDGGASVPVSGDRVLITVGTTITLDGAYEWGDDSTSTIVINTVSTTRGITLRGKLSHSRSVNSSITCRGGFQIDSGGEHDMGTVASPIPQGVVAATYVNKSNASPALGKYNYECLTGGKFTYVGVFRKRHTVLTAAAAAAATTIYVEDATGWQVGDLLHITGDNAGSHQNVTITGSYTPGSLTVPLAAGLTTAKRSGIAVGNATSNVLITSQASATRGGWGVVTSSTEVANTREIRNVKFLDLTGGYPYNSGPTFRCTDNYGSTRYTNPYTSLDSLVFGNTTAAADLFSSAVGGNVPYTSSINFTSCLFAQLSAPGAANPVYVGSMTTMTDCLFSTATPMLNSQYLGVLSGCKIAIGHAGSAPLGSNSGNTAAISGCQFSGVAYAHIQYSSLNVQRLTFIGCDFGVALPTNAGLGGFHLSIAPALLQNTLTNCAFGSFPVITTTSQERMTTDSYIKVINKNGDTTAQEDYRYNYSTVRSNSQVKRSTSSLSMQPITIGLAATRNQEIFCANGATLRVIGYIKSDANFYNGGGSGWYAPSVDVSGLGVTTGTVNGASGVAPTFSGTTSATWEQYDIAVTNTSGADGYFTLTYTVNPRAVTTGIVYFDGVTEAPFVTRARHYGFVFDEANPARTVNAVVSASEATASAYTGITVTWATSAIVLTADTTLQYLYDYTQYQGCQPANQPYAAALIGVGLAGSPSLFAAGNITTTGYTLNGGGVLAMGSYTLTASLPWAYTYTGGTFSQTATVPTFNGGQLNIGAAGTYTFVMAGSTIVSMAPSAPGTYAMGAASFTGTVDLRNAAAHAITVQLPAGTTYTTASNVGGAITVTLPATYQSVTVNGLVVGSRVQIYDLTSNTELANAVAVASTYTWTDSVAASASRAIRLRVAYVSGASAKNFIEANIGTCGTGTGDAAVSYLANQTDDATYNTNAIVGSAVTGITIAPSPARVSVNIAGGDVAWSQIYAYQVYWLATAVGIADQAAFITAPDTANYLLTGFEIRNTSAIPLTITGGYGRDAVTGMVKDCIDVAGSTGNIYPAPDHVVASIVSVGGANIITGDIATVLAAIPAAATNATAVRSELSAELAFLDAPVSTRATPGDIFAAV